MHGNDWWYFRCKKGFTCHSRHPQPKPAMATKAAIFFVKVLVIYNSTRHNKIGQRKISRLLPKPFLFLSLSITLLWRRQYSLAREISATKQIKLIDISISIWIYKTIAQSIDSDRIGGEKRKRLTATTTTKRAKKKILLQRPARDYVKRKWMLSAAAAVCWAIAVRRVEKTRCVAFADYYIKYVCGYNGQSDVNL